MRPFVHRLQDQKDTICVKYIYLSSHGFQVLSPCRSFHLEESSPYFLRLAPTELKSLTCAPSQPTNQMEKPNITRIVQLGQLTKLKLQAYRQFPNLEPLHALQLRKLCLVDCFQGMWPAVTPAIFQFLHTLHIEDSGDVNFAGEGPLLERKLDQIGDSILKMGPQLTHLSGNGILLAVARMGGLHPTWQLSAGSKHAESGVYTWKRWSV